MTDAPLQRGFWSDRKAKVQAELLAEEHAAVAKVNAADLAEQEAKPDEVLLEELGLPDPDDLALGDDIKGFMSKAVPDRLRRRALRQLWRLNPVLANVDGLLDYGEDFTDSAMVIENMQTAYQVGKGMWAHVQEMARQAEEKLALAGGKEAGEYPAEQQAQDVDVNDGAKDDAEPVNQDAKAVVADVDEPAGDIVEGALQETEYLALDLPPPRRRMRFHYDTPQLSESAA